MLEKLACVKTFVGYSRHEIAAPFHNFVNNPSANACEAY